MRKFALAIVLSLATPAFVLAQNQGDQYRLEGCVFLGLADSTLYRSTIEHGGVGVKAFVYRGLSLGEEAGYARWPGGINGMLLMSSDVAYHFRLYGSAKRVEPFAFGGFTVMVNSGHNLAGDYGGGLDVWVKKHVGMRAGLRVYTGNSVSPAVRLGQWAEFQVGLAFR